MISTFSLRPRSGRRAASQVGRGALCLAALALLPVAGEPLAAQEARTLTLQQAIEIAQRNGLTAQAALSSRDAARERDRAYGARLLPQISLSGNVPSYNRSIIQAPQPDGSTLFRPQQQTNSDLSMVLLQQLPLTGGTLRMSSRIAQLKRTGESATETWNSTPFSVTLTQPILRSNSIGWDNRANALSADVAERQYLEAREDVALQTATAFFDYYAAQLSLRNAEANTAVNDTLYRLNQGRYEVGKIAENDLLQSELQLLRARTSLDGSRLEHDRAKAALRLALNLAPDEPLEITVTTEVPEFAADTAQAVAQALRNRSQIMDLELQATTADRRVSEARWNGGVGATLNATYGYNATAPEMNEAYRDLQQAQQLTLNVQVPILQWGARSADREAAQLERQRVQSSSRATREQIAQEAHFAALQLSQARRLLQIAAKADTVAAKRYEVAYNRYLIGVIDVDALFLAQNEKDQALISFIQALRGYWQAHYRLRRLTLFDFERGVRIQ
ncbi:MAG TPA: TolC family protein [Gemmatimonadaceae bacterium]|nr:TolC family protein [Gemmatimonadaceae bacterium]